MSQNSLDTVPRVFLHIPRISSVCQILCQSSCQSQVPAWPERQQILLCPTDLDQAQGTSESNSSAVSFVLVTECRPVNHQLLQTELFVLMVQDSVAVDMAMMLLTPAGAQPAGAQGSLHCVTLCGVGTSCKG